MSFFFDKEKTPLKQWQCYYCKITHGDGKIEIKIIKKQTWESPFLNMYSVLMCKGRNPLKSKIGEKFNQNIVL